MIRVTIEILPGGYAEGRRTIGLMHIANISDLARRSDYRVDLTEGENPLTGTKAFTCAGYVRGHDRNQSVWSLVWNAIAAVKDAEFGRGSG